MTRDHLIRIRAHLLVRCGIPRDIAIDTLVSLSNEEQKQLVAQLRGQKGGVSKRRNGGNDVFQG